MINVTFVLLVIKKFLQNTNFLKNFGFTVQNFTCMLIEKINLFTKTELTRNNRAERDSAWVHFPHGDNPPNNILNKSKSTLYAS